MKRESVMKPLSISRNDFINDLTNLINNSMLPSFVIEEILKDMYNRICVMSKQQLAEDMKRYREALESAATKDVTVI